MNFNKVNLPLQGRSHHDLSAVHTSSMDFGRIDVCYHTELVPGDTARFNLKNFYRAAPMPCPTNGKVRVEMRAFFVPHRLHTLSAKNQKDGDFCWDTFITQTDASEAVMPVIRATDIKFGMQKFNDDTTLSKYYRDMQRHLLNMHTPAPLVNDKTTYTIDQNPYPRYLNAFAFRSYQLVWWHYFRNQQILPESDVNNYIPLYNSVNSIDDLHDNIKKWITPRYACFKKDYFTTATESPSGGAYISSPTYSSGTSSTGIDQEAPEPDNVFARNGNHATQATYKMPILALRWAEAIQKYAERNNIVGAGLLGRFLARYGNAPEHLAIDVPLLVGSSSNFMLFGDVTANNSTNGTWSELDYGNAFNTYNGSNTPENGLPSIAGQLAGKGAYGAAGDYNTFHAKEFGTFIVVQYCMPEVGYYQGWKKNMLRTDLHSFFTPEMQKVGFQTISDDELFVKKDVDPTIFGFTPRYSDYMFEQNTLGGDLALDELSTGMSSWHMMRIFEDIPEIGLEFTDCVPEARLALNRIFSVQGELCQLDHFVGYAYVDMQVDRPMIGDALPELNEDSNQSINIEYGGIRL